MVLFFYVIFVVKSSHTNKYTIILAQPVECRDVGIFQFNFVFVVCLFVDFNACFRGKNINKK